MAVDARAGGDVAVLGEVPFDQPAGEWGRDLDIDQANAWHAPSSAAARLTVEDRAAPAARQAAQVTPRASERPNLTPQPPSLRRKGGPVTLGKMEPGRVPFLKNTNR